MEKTGFTIRRKIILPIIVLVIAVLGLFGLAACGEEMIKEQDIIDRGYECLVVYDFNGGLVNSVKKNAGVRVFMDSHLPEPGSDLNADFKAPSYVGHSLKGFYKAATRYNEETQKDEVIYDKYVEIEDDSKNKSYIPYIESDYDAIEDDKKPVIVEFARASDEEWNFSSGTVNSDLTLVAVWWENFNVEFHYGDKIKNIEVERKKNGDPDTVLASDMTVGKDNFTILNYYLDSAKTDEIEAQTIDGEKVFSIDREYFENSDDGLTATVWCNYLDGIYQVVRSVSNFNSLSFGSQDLNVYLDCDLDLTGRSSSDFFEKYNGIFRGNGHTIKNLKIKKSDEDGGDVGMFSTLMSDAVLSDITFENVSLEIELSNAEVPNYTIGILAGDVLSGATVSGVHVSGTVSYKITKGVDADKIKFNNSSFFGYVSGEAKVTDSTAEIKSYTGSEAVLTADNAYAVYVWFTVEDGDKKYGSAYALYSINSNLNTYRSISDNLTYDEDNDVYTCTASRKNYTIKLTESDDGISAEVTQG